MPLDYFDAFPRSGRMSQRALGCNEAQTWDSLLTKDMWAVEPSVYLIAACLPTMHHIVAAATPPFIAQLMSKKLSWLSRLGKSSGKTSLVSGSPACGTADFHPYIGNDVDLEILGQVAKVEAVELRTIENGRRLSRIEGIMVTQEVEVTHEDRIASVLGF